MTQKPDWLKTLKPPEERGELRYHLHRHLSGRRPGRSFEHLHASDVIDHEGWWCPREIAIKVSEGRKPDPERISTATSLVYFQGNQLAQFVIQKLADVLEVVGDWKCTHCNLKHEFDGRPEVCEDTDCGGRGFKYEEHRFKSSYSGVSGGIDLLVRFPGDDLLTLVELKTMQKSAFQDLKTVLGEHRLRTNFYMRLVEEADYQDRINTATAKILYITKGGWGVMSDDPKAWGFDDDNWTPFKEFTIVRDDDQTNYHSELARRYHLWRTENGPFPKGICATQMCKRAQKCNVRKQCFGNYA